MSAPGIAAAAALAATGTLLGLAPGSLPINATLALAALLLLLVSLVVVWRLLQAYPARTAWSRTPVALTRREATGPAVVRGRILRLDKLLFFLGAATVVEVSWRPSGLTLSDACFVAAFAWCCVCVLCGRSVERVPTLLAVGVCVFAIGGLASAIGAVSPGRSTYEVVRGVFVMLLWPWTATMVLRDRRDLLIALGFWAMAGTIDGLAALGQTTGLSAIAGPLAGNRATGFGGPNDLGAAMGALLVPAFALALKFPARLSLLRVLQWLVVAVVASALVLSGSVSAMAGGLIALLLWTISPSVRASIRVTVVLGLAGAVVLSSVLGSSVPSPLHRVQEVFAAPGSEANAGSAQGHLDTVSYAWPRIRRDPFVGIGLDNTSTLVHSGVIAAWLGGGIFALVGLLLVFAGALSFGWWAAISATNEADRSVAWALVCAIVAFAVFFANQPLFFNQYGFIAMALLVAWGVRVTPRWSGALGQGELPAISPRDRA